MLQSILDQYGPWGLVTIGAIVPTAILIAIAVIFQVRRNLEDQRTADEIAALNASGEKLRSDLNEANERIVAANDEHNSLQRKFAALTERVSRLPELESDRTKLQSALHDERRRSDVLKTRLEEQHRALKEKMALLDEARAKMSENFENLANRILEEKSERFGKEHGDRLQTMLAPLREQIGTFSETVRKTHNADIDGRASLRNELKNLRDLNSQLNQEAVNLTRALKGDAKARGNWGEFSLKRLLESSGLIEGQEYHAEKSHRDGQGKLFRPDFIVKLPGKRDVVIDSKVALNAYVEYCDAEDPKDREAAMGRHVLAIRNHVKQLSAKDYGQLHGLDSLDYVLMFVPIEAAFIDALNTDRGIFEDAFSKRNVIIVSPTNLFAVLRTVASMWRMEYRSQNAEEIADRAGRLYDKFVLFAESLLDVGVKLDGARDSYQMALSRLKDGRGNVVGQVEKLKTLGARASKEMPTALEDHGDSEHDTDETLTESLFPES